MLNEEILLVRRRMHAPGKRYPACVPGATPGIPGIVIMYGRGEGGIIVDDRGWGLVRALAPGLCEVAAVWPWHGVHAKMRDELHKEAGRTTRASAGAVVQPPQRVC